MTPGDQANPEDHRQGDKRVHGIALEIRNRHQATANQQEAASAEKRINNWICGHGRTLAHKISASREPRPVYGIDSMPTQRPLVPWNALAGVLMPLLMVSCGSTELTGSGDIAEERYSDLGEFVRLETDSSISVTVARGDQREVVVRADDNVIDDVVVESDGDRLSIRVDSGVRLSNARLEADVVTPELLSVEANGASAVTVQDDFQPDRFKVSATGASEVTAELDTAEASLSASGSSTVILDGSSDSVTAEVLGASEMELSALEATDMEIDLSGSSNAVVTVTGKLSASASGSSELLYEGDPSIERSETSGSSSISPR